MKKIYLIVDDLGNSEKGFELLEKIKRYNININLAFLPDAKFTKEMLDLANKLNNIKSILHLPLQGISELKFKAITVNDDKHKINSFIDDCFIKVPSLYCNSHEGSVVSQNEDIVRIILNYMKNNKKFFIDSKTTRFSLFGEIAKEIDCSIYVRDLFLDDENSFCKFYKMISLKENIVCQSHIYFMLNNIERLKDIEYCLFE